MIQVLGYREYFNKTKEAWDVKHVIFEECQPKSIADLFENHKSYLELIPEDERYNLHYTLADCYKAPRLFKSQNVIPFDIDDIDTSKLDSYIALVSDGLSIPFTEMGITFSGHGLHFLVEIDHVISSTEELTELRTPYKRLLERLQLMLKSAKLPGKFDNQVLRNAGTLRFPGTENRCFPKAKPDKVYEPKMSYAINDKVKTQRNFLAFVTPVEGEQIAPQSLRKFPKPDTEFVIKECEFLKWNFESPDEVSEPEWYAALSIVGALENGRDLAHVMSKKAKCYDFTTTERKLEQAMKASGPRTCANIDTISDKCQKCKYFGQVTSPVMLRGPEYIGTLDSGFWIIGPDKNGKIKPIRPDYEGLRRFFEQKNKYISTPSGSVFVWEGKKYLELQEAFIREFVEINMNPGPNNTQVNEFISLVNRTNVRSEDFFEESTIGKLNLSNGVLNLDSMELEPHNPNLGFRYCLDHEYDAKATCPRFDEFMKEVTLGRLELQQVLMEYAAFAFSGMPYIHHKALLMSGEGSNGKSSFITVLRKLAGKDSCSSLMINEFDQEYKRAYMIGKLFNVAEETPVKALDSSWFKILSAGGPFIAREIYKKPVSVTSNRTKLIMACNELPEMSDFSEGFIRRLIIVPFDARFIEGVNADPEIDAKLERELPGILNRVIEAYQRLRAQKGFTKSAIVAETVKEYKDSQNTVSNWMNEMVDVDHKKEEWFEASTKLYKAYVDWCKPMQLRPISVTKFGVEVSKTSGKKSIPKRIDGKLIRGYDCLRLNISDALNSSPF